MIKIFRNSFSFKRIYSLKNTKLSTITIYFCILVMMISFPLNYKIILEDGFKGLTAFTTEMQLANPEWFPNELPSDMYITNTGLNYINDQTYTYSTTTTDQVTYTIIINPKSEMLGKNLIVLEEKRIIYFDSLGNSLVGQYRKVGEVIDFSDLKNMDTTEAKNIFFTMIDNGFSEYAVFYSIFANTIIQFIMNSLLAVILAAIMLLVRINYKRVTSFSQNIKIVISSMTIPAIISFLVGIFGIIELNSFVVVIFQLLTPIIALLTIYKGCSEKENIIKDL